MTTNATLPTSQAPSPTAGRGATPSFPPSPRTRDGAYYALHAVDLFVRAWVTLDHVDASPETRRKLAGLLDAEGWWAARQAIPHAETFLAHRKPSQGDYRPPEENVRLAAALLLEAVYAYSLHCTDPGFHAALAAERDALSHALKRDGEGQQVDWLYLTLTHYLGDLCANLEGPDGAAKDPEEVEAATLPGFADLFASKGPDGDDEDDVF